ncbi:hypothetical protein KC19_VG204200 [Ceratodon purpureus]|uniref:Secreted protein n=1 Tax=Ceratodon purpureus TaxID=3225 RepID=A0A8T0HSE7_CERPU|nr:hypothetical protein KC19_VG204200 [Ceratodon purpureus]
MTLHWKRLVQKLLVILLARSMTESYAFAGCIDLRAPGSPRHLKQTRCRIARLCIFTSSVELCFHYNHQVGR